MSLWPSSTFILPNQHSFRLAQSQQRYRSSTCSNTSIAMCCLLKTCMLPLQIWTMCCHHCLIEASKSPMPETDSWGLSQLAILAASCLICANTMFATPCKVHQPCGKRLRCARACLATGEQWCMFCMAVDVCLGCYGRTSDEVTCMKWAGWCKPAWWGLSRFTRAAPVIGVP